MVCVRVRDKKLSVRKEAATQLMHVFRCVLSSAAAAFRMLDTWRPAVANETSHSIYNHMIGRI